MAGAPLGVVVGETVPRGAAEQDTLQVTPRFVESLPTVAVTCAVVPASTVVVAAEAETLLASVVNVSNERSESYTSKRGAEVYGEKKMSPLLLHLRVPRVRAENRPQIHKKKKELEDKK